MRLDGKVNDIKRILARQTRNGQDQEEKRVYGLTVRLPDTSLQADYNYGYGSMSFILHGKSMRDFVDLGGEVDIYVVPKGLGQDVPQREFEDLRTRTYELEGMVESLTQANELLKNRNQIMQQESQAIHQRLKVAMDEVMRLEARIGIQPPAPAQLTDER